MKKVDFRRNAILASSRADLSAWRSISTPKVDSSIDRRALQSKARDDRKTSNATNLHKQLGGRICDEKTSEAVQGVAAAGFFSKVGLCSGEQGDKTRASIDSASHKLPALSRKANAKRSKK